MPLQELLALGELHPGAFNEALDGLVVPLRGVLLELLELLKGEAQVVDLVLKGLKCCVDLAEQNFGHSSPRSGARAWAGVLRRTPVGNS